MELLLKRLIYRSKNRGCKEMDIILGNYAASGIKKLTRSELELYSNFLEEADNDIWNWVSGKISPPNEYAALIGKIKNDT